MRRYSAYKESGVHWIGEIPKHWESVKLKWKSRIYAGGTPSKRNGAYWRNGTIPWLNSGTVNQFKIHEPSAYITEEALSNSSAKWIPSDSLVMALAGQGKTKGLVAQVKLEATCNQSMAVIVPNDQYDSRFILYYLKRNYRNIRNLGGGDKRDGLNLQMIGDIVIPFIGIKEQQAIASFLDTKTSQIDHLIQLKERKIELLKEKRTALINETVTKGLNPDVEMKDSGVEWIGEIPKHWDSKKIAWIFFNIGSGTTPKSTRKEYYENGDVNWLNTGDLNDSFIETTSKRITKKAIEDYSTLKKYPIGSLVVAMYGATIGKLGLLNIETTTNQACCVLSKPKNVSTKYVFYWFLANRPDIINRSYGGGQPNISQDIIKNLRIPTPFIKEQRKIVEYLDTETELIDKTVSFEERKIELLKEYKQALISEVVTGKVRVYDQDLSVSDPKKQMA